MILSFSITSKLAERDGVTDPLITRQKTCSRRIWTNAAARSWVSQYNKGRRIHSAWTNLPYVPGAHEIGTFELVCEPYQERLGDMPEAELYNEGGFWRDRDHFIQEIGNNSPNLIVWVVRWKNFAPSVSVVNVPK